MKRIPATSRRSTARTSIPAEAIVDETKMTQPEVVRHFGVSVMTLWRWRNDDKLKFPKSNVINERHYFKRSEILSWIAPPKPPRKRSGARLAAEQHLQRNG